MSRTDELDEFEFIDYEEQETNMKNSKQSKGKKVKKRKRSILEKLVIFVEAVIALMFAVVIVVYATPNMTSKMLNSSWGQTFLASPFGQRLLAGMMDKEGYQNVYDDSFDKNSIQTNDELDLSILDDYMNIALFGVDEGFEKDRPSGGSDCIMIVSIHKETSDVKVVSIYRDTYMNIVDKNGRTDRVYPYYKVNYAYNAGGAEGAVNTLNKNLDLNIQDYVTVNFNGLAIIIDLLGGIDVNITADEMYYINGYLTETRLVTGMDSPDVTTFGNNIHLNGLQATAYSRIRYVPIYMEDGTELNNDFGRAARQRNVITKMVAKAKDAGMENVMKMCDEIYKSDEKVFVTSIPYEDIVKLIPVILNFSFGETQAFPYTLKTPTLDNAGSSVVACGLDYNVIQLHKFLFPEENYSPSNTVSDISEDIYYDTGIETEKLDDFNDNILR